MPVPPDRMTGVMVRPLACAGGMCTSVTVIKVMDRNSVVQVS
ncbi:hypothetical protein SXCC_04115 [Gluconacetobacter sp. SXCC-1]|nr:hypothetical protein SXCC_04115 [Gluconacetobacter sp. SXCC-1]